MRAISALVLVLCLAAYAAACPPVAIGNDPVQVQSFGVHQQAVQVFAAPQVVTTFATPVFVQQQFAVANQVAVVRQRGCASGVCGARVNVLNVQQPRVRSRSVTRVRSR